MTRLHPHALLRAVAANAERCPCPAHHQAVYRTKGREGLTLYAWWSARFGLWPLWILATGVVAFAAVLRLRQSEHHQARRNQSLDGR